GWVYGGLALLIQDLPPAWEGAAFYVKLFQQMSETLQRTQRADGTWSAGLLGDPKDYPTIETSGTSFFVFGLAWGIRNGLLDKATYEPVLLKAWRALEGAVTEEGMVTYVQPVGAAPGYSYPDYTELYGSGAFLCASAEMYRYVTDFDPTADRLRDRGNATTFMHNGGWCWYQDPRALISNETLVIGGLDGQTGDVNIGVYDLTQDSILDNVTLAEDFEIDDHDVPALYARQDGSLLAVWAKHGKENLHHLSFSAPDNYLEWEAPSKHEYGYKIPAGKSWTGMTYMNLYYLSGEERLYNFFRHGKTYNPSFSKSADEGRTWDAATHFITNDVTGRQRPYARYAQPDEQTIGISYTDAHPRQYGNSVYYVQYRDGAFFRVDGTKIKDLAGGPLRTSEGEKIYTGSETKEKPKGYESVPNSAWTCAMGQDAVGNPHVGYSLYLSNDDHRYRIASWDGKQWNDREIAYAGKCLYQRESSYTGLMAFDPTNP
ncbi:MAG: glycoside hydrolase family 88 protein, partial [Bacteroidota bacterium]